MPLNQEKHVIPGITGTQKPWMATVFHTHEDWILAIHADMTA
jgi:hypothetical protein